MNSEIFCLLLEDYCVRDKRDCVEALLSFGEGFGCNFSTISEYHQNCLYRTRANHVEKTYQHSREEAVAEFEDVMSVIQSIATNSKKDYTKKLKEELRINSFLSSGLLQALSEHEGQEKSDLNSKVCRKIKQVWETREVEHGQDVHVGVTTSRTRSKIEVCLKTGKGFKKLHGKLNKRYTWDRFMDKFHQQIKRFEIQNKLRRTSILQDIHQMKQQLGEEPKGEVDDHEVEGERPEVEINEPEVEREGPGGKEEVYEDEDRETRVGDGESEVHIPKEFPCDADGCLTMCTSRDELYNHKYRVHSGRKFVCDICDEKFRMRGHLKEHMAIHGDRQPLECETCHKHYKSEVTLKNHMAMYNAIVKQTCSNCHVEFDTRHNFDQHSKVCHSDNGFICECGKEYTSKGSLTTHKKTHGGVRFACGTCGRSYSTKYNLAEHKRKKQHQTTAGSRGEEATASEIHNSQQLLSSQEIQVPSSSQEETQNSLEETGGDLSFVPETPLSPKSESGYNWKCQSCTFLNAASDEKCENCDAVVLKADAVKDEPAEELCEETHDAKRLRSSHGFQYSKSPPTSASVRQPSSCTPPSSSVCHLPPAASQPPSSSAHGATFPRKMGNGYIGEWKKKEPRVYFRDSNGQFQKQEDFEDAMLSHTDKRKRLKSSNSSRKAKRKKNAHEKQRKPERRELNPEHSAAPVSASGGSAQLEGGAELSDSFSELSDGPDTPFPQAPPRKVNVAFSPPIEEVRKAKPVWRSRKRVVWNPKEERALIQGMRKHGVGNWTVIMEDVEISKHFHESRDDGKIKDKYRNMMKHCHLPHDFM